MDKKMKSNKNFLARFRGWIQAAATLLTNIHIPNLFKGKIYQGNVKTMCVPGLNCYSCPAATGACPIGAFQIYLLHHRIFHPVRCSVRAVYLWIPLSVWMVPGSAA